MEELTGFGRKFGLTLPSLTIKNFNSLRDENDEPIYTYNDKHIRHFVRQSIKGESCSALNQYYKSTILDQVSNNISKEINVNRIMCEILENFFERTNKHYKTLEIE